MKFHKQKCPDNISLSGHYAILTEIIQTYKSANKIVFSVSLERIAFSALAVSAK